MSHGPRVFTPSTLARELDQQLRRTWSEVAVEGEVGQTSIAGSGHLYLVLRDREATLNCVMWRGDLEQSPFRPAVGQRVVATGRLAVYPSQSRYQLYLRALRPSGEGELAKKLEKIKQRLAADGLLDPRRRRPLPESPAVIGLVTSPSGAALHDFLEVSRLRYPATRILLAPSVVQGPEAPSSLIRALELLVEDGRADVIVVTRGGGAREDLSAFDDEYLARWVATSPIPVVSAVGHQVDATILDLVADAVAPTPSAAAVAVLPDAATLRQRVDEGALALTAAVGRMIRSRADAVRALQRGLRSPRDRVRDARRRREELVGRLDAAVGRSVAQRRQRLEALRARLESLGPQQVLDRGYAIVRGPHGVVRDAARATPGDLLQIRVAAGELQARVIDPSD